MSTKIRGPAKLPRTYHKLCGLLTPRKIHDDTDLEAAQEMIDSLAVLPTRTRDQDDYLETLAELVEAYEEHHVRMARKPGLGTLKFLLSENGLTASDLSRLLGSDISLGYRILSGERGLTTRHIRKLAGHFRVGPEVLF
jgi:antitoxin component HigA of HigAB toxin-antitoxin module